jgi:hypothetical protein
MFRIMEDAGVVFDLPPALKVAPEAEYTPDENAQAEGTPPPEPAPEPEYTPAENAQAEGEEVKS